MSVTQSHSIYFIPGYFFCSSFQNPYLCLCCCWGWEQSSWGWAGASVKRQTQSRWIALKRSLIIVFHWCWIRPCKCDPTALMLVTNPTETQGAAPMCTHYQIQCAVLTSILQEFSSSLGCTMKGRAEAGKGKERQYMSREILSWLWRIVMFCTECKYLKK